MASTPACKADIGEWLGGAFGGIQKSPVLTALLALTLQACATFQPSAPSSVGSGSPANLLIGEFSNAGQVALGAAMGEVRYQFLEVPCAGRPADICLFSRRYQAPNFDQAVAPRLYLFRNLTHGVRVMIEPLPVDLVDLVDQPNPGERLSSIPPGGLDQECAITLMAQAGSWYGETDPSRCKVPVAGIRQGLQRKVRVSAQGFDLTESVYDQGGALIAGHQPDQGIEARRVRYFVGRAGVDKERTGQWQLSAQLRIDDAGRVLDLVNEQGNTLGYKVRLLAIPGSDGQQAMLRLSVIDGSSDKTLSYAWAQTESQQIGLHLGWFQSGFRLETNN